MKFVNLHHADSLIWIKRDETNMSVYLSVKPNSLFNALWYFLGLIDRPRLVFYIDKRLIYGELSREINAVVQVDRGYKLFHSQIDVDSIQRWKLDHMSITEMDIEKEINPNGYRRSST